MSSEQQIPDSVRHRQAAASDPDVSAFVAANAGSGKTHVLAQRVVRLLLAGVSPERILCITFTKAAAANMAQRVFDTLAEWIALDDEALDDAVHKIGVPAGDPARRALARRLFACALETPGGLKVQTIHALCTRLLQQFPFEANVSAGFTVLDERMQAELLDRATLAPLIEAAADRNGALGRALAAAIVAAADTTFREVVGEAVNRRDDIMTWIEAAGSLEAAIGELSGALGIDPGDTVAAVEREIIEGPIFPSATWAATAERFAAGSKRDQDQASRLTAALRAEGSERAEAYLRLFIDSKSSPRTNLITQRLGQSDPALKDRLAQEQARVLALHERRNAIICRDRTAALLTIAAEVIARYRREKERRGLMDYDDLIDKTLAMLDAVNPTWVHYKLDHGIDHVLIDEAQDTSPKQWEIIRRLVSEFTAGAGARAARRTIFAVGDEKQSIFTFQGAAPKKFDEMRRAFARQFKAAELGWRDVLLEHSFRSGANVLGAVDCVFTHNAVYRSVTSDADGMPPHLALPEAAPGLVEVWPLEKADEARELEGWDAPFDAVPETSPQVRLAQKIASTVGFWLAGGQRPGDVLILVRQRGVLFEAIIGALKRNDIAVAGADRLVLTEHIAVEDLMALADALLLPGDDLALAVALKSPLFGLDDDQLFKLAWRRTGTLHAALEARAHEDPACAHAAALINRCAALAGLMTPFAFYAWLLGPERGRAKILARLGLEAADALDEFLELALAYEAREAATLQGFVAWLRAAETEIKRDMEIARDEVRVMTVHGAKGLEAHTVILADTTSNPRGPRQPRLLAIPPAAPHGAPDRLVWAHRKDADVPVVAAAREAALRAAEDEYRRLLYVAMTRAAERLVLCGVEGARKPPDGCWYDLVVSALSAQPEFCEEPAQIGGTVRRFRRMPGAPAGAPQGSDARPRAPEPPWLCRDAPPEPPSPVPIVPSDSADETVVRGMPETSVEARRLARLRGALVHRLLQALPDLAAEQRAGAARRFLAHAGRDVPAAERDAMLAQVMAVLADPRFAPLFAPGSRAEVPIIGRIPAAGGPLAVSGQVDRLAVTAEEVLIADYKTNRPAPADVAQVPPGYVRQLALYRALLAKIYPGRPVRAALLWTDVPELMELSAERLDAEIAALTAA